MNLLDFYNDLQFCCLTVTLQSTGEADFRGYMIQARSGTDTTGIGSFSAEGSEGKTMDCPGGTAVCKTLTQT